MAKTKENEVVEDVVEESAISEARQIATDFGRDDLNELRDAVNELLRR